MQVVLTQSQPSPFNLGPGIDFACVMHDGNGVAQPVDVNNNVGQIKFNGYSSIGNMTNVVLTGPVGLPTGMTFDAAGTGNLPGKNNAAYTGNCSWVLAWEQNEVTHRWTVIAVSGTATLNY